jgi:hypothetical protein
VCCVMLRCCAAGVQALLDGVSDYLPCPTDVDNTALDLDHGEQALTLPCRSGEAHSTPSQQPLTVRQVRSRLKMMVGLQLCCWGPLRPARARTGRVHQKACLLPRTDKRTTHMLASAARPLCCCIVVRLVRLLVLRSSWRRASMAS